MIQSPLAAESFQQHTCALPPLWSVRHLSAGNDSERAESERRNHPVFSHLSLTLCQTPVSSEDIIEGRKHQSPAVQSRGFLSFWWISFPFRIHAEQRCPHAQLLLSVGPVSGCWRLIFHSERWSSRVWQTSSSCLQTLFKDRIKQGILFQPLASVFVRHCFLPFFKDDIFTPTLLLQQLYFFLTVPQTSVQWRLEP